MHPLEFAMQMELEGKEFYLQQAQRVEDASLKELFQALAADEEKHYEVIRQMQDSGRYDFQETTILTAADSVFAAYLEGHEPPPTSYLEIYNLAIEFEEKAAALYNELAVKAGCSRERELFLKLAQEEETHRKILWNLRELLQRPEEWYPYLS